MTVNPPEIAARRRKEDYLNLPFQSDGRTIVSLSDLHLGPVEPFGLPLSREEALASVIAEAAEKRQPLVLNGDIIDRYQSEGNAQEILERYTLVVKALEAASKRTDVFYLRGNHDWQDGEFDHLTDWTVCDGLLVDGNTLFLHGHQFDRLEIRGWAPSMERAHVWIQETFNTKFHPSSDEPSLGNKVLQSVAGSVAELGTLVGKILGSPQWARDLQELIDFLVSKELGVDPGMMLQALVDTPLDGNIKTVVCGHSHLPGVVPVYGVTYVNSGTWNSYAAPVVRTTNGQPVVQDRISSWRYGAENYEGWDTPIDWLDWWRNHAVHIHPRTVVGIILSRVWSRWAYHHTHPREDAEGGPPSASGDGASG